MASHSRTNDDPYQTEYDTRDAEIARRNILFGLWAGQRMGLESEAIEDYAWSVHLADGENPGHDDVIAKVATDLARCGRPIYSALDQRPELKRLRLGTVDTPFVCDNAFHIYTDSKASWWECDDGLPRFSEHKP